MKYVAIVAIGLLLLGCTGQTNSKAMEFCGKSNVAKVYICGENVRVVSSLMGGGSTYYKKDGSSFTCPVVAPDSMSSECKQIFQADLNNQTSCTEVC